MIALNILIIEDSDDDTALAVHALKQAGYEIAHTQVATGADFSRALDVCRWDAIVSDYTVPGFGALEALNILHDSGRDLPFIVISGTVGEERTAEIMKAGAHDFIVKSNLSRLSPAITRELRDAGMRAGKRKIEDEHARIASILEATTDLVAMIDPKGHILYINQAGSDWLGLADKVEKTCLFDYYPPWAGKLLREAAIPAAIEEGAWQGEAAIVDAGGTDIPVSQVIIAHRKRCDSISYLSTIARDISERKHYEHELRYQLTHDSLTRLPNRVLLMDRTAQAIAAARRNKFLAAVLFLDIDNFKQINDALGHTAGDSCLCEAATRLADCLRGGDTLGRYGGDEFLSILGDLKEAGAVDTVIRKIRAAFQRPVTLDSNEIYLTLSIGVSLYPQDGTDAESLLKYANVAMHSAKRFGRDEFKYYLPAMSVNGKTGLVLESDLRRAIEREEFILHYQPQLDLARNKITAVEALIRWQHPQKGLIPPKDFIPALERTGLIRQVGRKTFCMAVRQAQDWKARG